MSQDDAKAPSDSGDLGPAPEPKIEPGEPNPGGVDAIEFPDGAEATAPDAVVEAPVMRDLDPEANPAVEDALPDEVKEGEDTSTEATRSNGEDAEDDVDPEEEAPA